MKIRIRGPAHPYRGGIAKFDETLASAFAREGHDVKIVNFTLQYPSFLFPGETQYTRMAAPEGLAIERRINSVNPLNWPAVGREVAGERPELVAGTQLTGVKLELQKQDTVVFYILRDYRIVVPQNQAA